MSKPKPVNFARNSKMPKRGTRAYILGAERQRMVVGVYGLMKYGKLTDRAIAWNAALDAVLDLIP